MFARDSILVSLSPTSLRVGVLTRGEVARVERVVLDDGAFDDAWKAGLRPLDDVLRRAIIALGVRPGTPAHVVYASPRLMAEVFVAPTTGAAAMQAAKMYVRQSVPDAGRGWLTCAEPMLQVQQDGKETREVLLLTADLEENINLLGEWVNRCGLVATAVAPAKALLLERAMRAGSSGEAPNVHVYLDEHAMTLCGWVGKHLAFARCADIGYAILADALHRASRPLTDAAPTREYAVRLLFTAGIPVRGQVLDPARGLLADTVLPLVQPALQRCVIEVRQTLRFGLSEADLARATTSLSGPGASIPGISQAISDHLEMPLEVSQLAKDGPTSGVAEDQVGDLAAAAGLRDSKLWVVPPRLIARVHARHAKFAVRMGGIAAMLVLAGLWGNTRRACANADAQLASIKPRAAEVDHINNLRERLATDTQHLSQVCSLVDSALGRHTSWLGALALAPQDIRKGIVILSVQGEAPRDSDGSPLMTIQGRVTPTAETTPDVDPVSAFVASLVDSPLVAAARVVSTRSDGATGNHEFVVEVQLRNVPGSSPILAGEGSGGASGRRSRP